MLERVREEHAERLRELRMTPEVARWWEPPVPGWPLEHDPEDEPLAIVVDGEVAGFVNVFEEPDPNARHADVDIFLGPDHVDRGLGTAVMEAVVRHLTGERGHHRITLSVSVGNDRALRVYEKVGFRRVGVLRKSQRSHTTGEWQDELLMELVV